MKSGEYRCICPCNSSLHCFKIGDIAFFNAMEYIEMMQYSQNGKILYQTGFTNFKLKFEPSHEKFNKKLDGLLDD